ncbi:hypothetical protein SLA2020_435480 [Shorea laevis]
MLVPSPPESIEASAPTARDGGIGASTLEGLSPEEVQLSDTSPMLLSGQCSAKPLKFYNRKSATSAACFFSGGSWGFTDLFFSGGPWGFTDLFGGCSRPGKQCPSN